MATEVREGAARATEQQDREREREREGARVRETKRRTRLVLAGLGGLLLGGFFLWIMLRMASSAEGGFALPMLLGFLVVAAAVAVSAKLWVAGAVAPEDGDGDDEDSE
jgi:F0F1-type ATP synthase assembly protein I